MREVDDPQPGLLSAVPENRGIERLPGAPGRERGRRDERVQLQRELGAFVRREERVDLEDAELAERRRLDLADQEPRSRSTRAPRILDQVREQDVLAARERVRGDTDESEQARHGALDLVAEGLGSVSHELGRSQRADDVERDPASEPGV